MRFALLTLCLLLSACAPVVYVTPGAGDGQILPEQLQRAADAYTATARVMATQAAGATSTEQSARATSTTSHLQTADALAVEQTRSALVLTEDAAHGQATDAAAVKTQSAIQTASYATPTVAAMRTQAVVSALETQRRAEDAVSWSEFWKTVRVLVVVVVVCYALAWVIVQAWDRAARIEIVKWRARAEIASATFRILSPSHYYEWQPGGGQVKALPPGQPDEPVIVEDMQPSASRLHAWRQALRMFAWWGTQYGFTRAALMALGVVTDPAYRVLAGVLKAADVLGDVVVPGKAGRQTGYVEGWNFPRLSDDLSSGRLDPYLPPDDDPPAVAFTVPTPTTTGNPTNPTTISPVVINGIAKAA